MTKAEALDILKTYREELNTALSDVDGIPVILDALDVAIEDLENPYCDACIGPGLAIAHGYTDMRTKGGRR